GSGQVEVVGDFGQPSGESCHSSWRPHGSRSINAKEWLSCSVPRPSVCQVRYTVSPSRRNTLTAKPAPGGAPTSAPNVLSDDEYQSILLPTLALYAKASSIGP